MILLFNPLQWAFFFGFFICLVIRWLFDLDSSISKTNIN
jgi:hypothetical protein